MTLLDQQSPSADPPQGYLRELDSVDFSRAERLLLSDPHATTVVLERIQEGRLDPFASGGRTLGWFERDELMSLLYIGANLAPVAATESARMAFAEYLSRRARVSSAIVGHSAVVVPLWEALDVAWGPCRELRPEQPLMAISHDPVIQLDGKLRRATLPDLDRLLQPSIDMFTEEVGVSPVAGGRGSAFRARVASSILEGRSYVIVLGGRVIFKAEVGAVAGGTAQLQGVWVAPAMRGQGLAVPAVAALVRAVRRDQAPNVNLYVNAHNTPALRTYRRVGFDHVGTFATVMF